MELRLAEQGIELDTPTHKQRGHEHQGKYPAGDAQGSAVRRCGRRQQQCASETHQ